ncbi:MAG: hypothetical protein Q9207_005203 [Kuettlingeria erythrocarpa]
MALFEIAPKHIFDERKDQYFAQHLALSAEDANMLHMEYYKNYGLAISGLVTHHKVDPLEYNREVDDALPLDGLITPNSELRRLLEDIDKSKVKMWLFTNAHITHAQRVVKLLGIEDLFEGITFCDYRQLPFVCKPHREMFEKAEAEAGVQSVEDCYFVASLKTTPILIVDMHKPGAGRPHICWRQIYQSQKKELPDIKFKI